MSIVINWAAIDSEDAFYRQLLLQLGAPDWHGHNLDALSDSVGTGGINAIEPPYLIEVIGTENIRPALLEFSRRVESVLLDAASTRSGIEIRLGVAQQAVQRDGPASGGSAR